jgi:branched-chain amino acid transport system ATP-binding protein
MTDLLRTDALTKGYGHIFAAERIDLSVRSGVLTSIIGPNGAGKTTFINLVSGKVKPDSGRVFFREREITHLPVHQRVELGIGRSFQIMNIFPRLTVFDNIRIPVLALKRHSQRFLSNLEKFKDVTQGVEEVLATIGLQAQKDLPAASLSHGDQRLVEIGISMATRPKLLFLDEPTAGMNPVERITILENIRRLAENGETTFVIVEHDMDIVFSLSDRIVVMHRGQVIADGSPDAIRQNQEVREIYLGEEVW